MAGGSATSRSRSSRGMTSSPCIGPCATPGRPQQRCGARQRSSLRRSTAPASTGNLSTIRRVTRRGPRPCAPSRSPRRRMTSLRWSPTRRWSTRRSRTRRSSLPPPECGWVSCSVFSWLTSVFPRCRCMSVGRSPTEDRAWVCCASRRSRRRLYAPTRMRILRWTPPKSLSTKSMILSPIARKPRRLGFHRSTPG